MPGLASAFGIGASTAAFGGAAGLTSAISTGGLVGIGSAITASSAASTAATLAGIGTAISAVGSIASGVSQAAAAKQQSRALEQQAARERQIAELNARDFRRRSRAAQARIRAVGGARGVAPGTGSLLDSAADFEAESEFNALKILSGGDVRAARLEQQASLERRAGVSNLVGSGFRAGSQLFRGGLFA